MRQVFVTRLGIISAIGQTISETYHALLNETSGIAPIKFLETHYQNKLLAAEVKASNETLRQHLQLPTPHSRTALLGIWAARAAFKDIASKHRIRTGLISATSVGGMDRTEKFYQKYLQNPQSGNLRDIRSHDCGDSTERIADDLGIRDFVTTISTACSSAANAIMLGTRMIRAGHLDRVLVGGTDALTRFTLNGFNSLKIIDSEPCKPFDETRKGLNLGEGAAFLMLESETSLNVSGEQPLALVSGYGNANDAFHQTASSPEGIGAFNAMQTALNVANLSSTAINYINAHGTATPNNDRSEGQAFKRLFGTSLPPFSSTKSFTGHTLAAAGAIEAVISILVLQHQFLPPNLNFEQAILDLNIMPVQKLQSNVLVQHVLSNSFGFGGNCTALVFSKI